MTALSQRPHQVGPNKVPVYYAGGERIDRFRGVSQEGGPEDWVASVTAFPPHVLPPGADPETGVSRLANGTSLRAAVREDPAGWLAPRLAAVYGDQPGLLVKLLDAGERLPVHCHPPRSFAQRKLGSRFGKTEGWIVLEATPDAGMWLGFNRDVDRDQLWRWIQDQDSEAMLAAMNQFRVRAGDVLYVPAGTIHSFGPGVLIVELQEPTSFSILAEYRRFGLSAEQATLGLSWDDALGCFDLRAYTKERTPLLRPEPQPVIETGERRGQAHSGGEIWRLFGAEAGPFFQAYRARAHGRLALEHAAGFSILVVEQGSGALISRAGRDEIAAGQTWVVPYAAAPVELDGDVEVIVCVPPDVSADHVP